MPYPYYVRPMRSEDIAQVTDIDHEAFPTMLPPANYQRELQIRIARYIVATQQGKTLAEDQIAVTPEKQPSSLVSRLKQFFSPAPSPPPVTPQYIVGFAGCWIMADEANITNLAVRSSYLRQGTGELLLISIIDIAIALNARILTLEVRVSNTIAQNLYRKYGFTPIGQRRGYYRDNKEDALMMSSEDILSAPFQSHLAQSKQAHSQKWGSQLS